MSHDSVEHQLNSVVKRLDIIERALGITSIDKGNITNVKAIIKRGSNDFNNNIKDNPFSEDSMESEWWILGFNYARELDEQ